MYKIVELSAHPSYTNVISWLHVVGIIRVTILSEVSISYENNTIKNEIGNIIFWALWTQYMYSMKTTQQQNNRMCRLINIKSYRIVTWLGCFWGKSDLKKLNHDHVKITKFQISIFNSNLAFGVNEKKLSKFLSN